jgi:O-antigen/teichoic acid export membrane protein
MRGALVSTAGQGANFVLRIGSVVVLTRLLTAEDFGTGTYGCSHAQAFGTSFGISGYRWQPSSASISQVDIPSFFESI